MTKNDLTNIPAAACSKCGGWTGFGGMSQYAHSTEKVLDRTGCICHNYPQLTDKEKTALKGIIEEALDNMGGKEPKDLHNDNYSWFSRRDLTARTGFSKHEAAGLMSSLADKGIICEEDNQLWVLTTKGINTAQEVL